MHSDQLNRNLAFGFTFLAILFYYFVFKTYHGTGDDGDSISHYLYARWSWEMKYIWLNHWGKPIFTFLSSPFAQFGFKGIQFFNTSLGILTGYLTHLVARKLEFKHSAFVIPLILLMPEYMKTSYSGLTEILFAFLLILSIYLFLNEKYVVSYTIVSFLPFCRPDGNAVIAMIGLLSLLHPVYRRYIYYLLTGHIALTIIGVIFFDENWLWLFTKNPNAYHEFDYANGGWLSYIKGLLSFMSLPIYILFWLGMVCTGHQFSKSKSKHKLIFIIYFIGLSIFTMHTILYKFSLFRGIGLLRYLVPIAPILGLLCLNGFEFLIDRLSKLKVRPLIACSLIILITTVYVFSPSKYSAHFPSLFDLNNTQKLSIEVLKYINEKIPNNNLKYYSYPYFSVLEEVNPNNWEQHRYLNSERANEDIPKGSILIWDDWYCVQDYDVTPSKLAKIPNLKLIRKFETFDNDKIRSFIVYLKE